MPRTLPARVAQVDYVERDPRLAAVVAYNLAQLKIENVAVHATEALQFLKATPHHYDWLYLDPARRDTASRKLFRLADCEPDVVKLLPLLLHKADRILLKTSPMLDIEQAVQELGQVRRLWVLALDNEVKEVLYELGPQPAIDPERYAVNLRRDGSQQEFRLNRAREARAVPRYAEAQQYLYEPNAAVLKAGAFRSVGTAFELLKLHQHSHLYTSGTLQNGISGAHFSGAGGGKSRRGGPQSLPGPRSPRPRYDPQLSRFGGRVSAAAPASAKAAKCTCLPPPTSATGPWCWCAKKWLSPQT